MTSACTACGACIATCPERAIVPAARRPLVTARCTGCGECTEICPRGAIVELAHTGLIRLEHVNTGLARTR